MKIKLSDDNTLGPTPHGLVWEYIKRRPSSKHLDYGTREGTFLKHLFATQKITEGYGLDLNPDAILMGGQSHQKANVNLSTIRKGEPLPHEDNTFDSISMIGVLEHIHDQDRILAELYRVLKQHGYLYVLVPGKHIFSFLDMGNLKFVFPKIHKFYVERKYSKDFYNEHFIQCKNGLFGDIEVEKMWHQHFDALELKKIIRGAGFKILEMDGIGYFRRIFINLKYFMPPNIKVILERFIQLDAMKFGKSEILVIAKK